MTEEVIFTRETAPVKDYIFVRCESKVHRVPFDEILYIEGMSEYVKIVTKNRVKPLLPLLSMRKMIDGLPKDRFMRIHRSYIVNLDAIDEVQRMHVIIGEESFPISEMYKEQFLQFVNSYIVD